MTTTNTGNKHTWINTLPTFAERGSAIAKRLESVKADPKYQKLSPEHQAKVRQSIYNKYVIPSYSGFHLPMPDEKTWVEASGRDTAYHTYGGKVIPLSETYGKEGEFSKAEDFNVGINKGATGISLFGLKVANSVLNEAFGLNQYFTKKMENFTHGDNWVSSNNEKLHKIVEQKLSNAIDSQRHALQSADFWTQTHPRSTMIGRLESDAGEFVSTLPIYEALGPVGAGLGEAAKALPLTERLMAKPVGKWVANRIINATDGYLATLVTSGGSTSEASKGAVGFAVGGAAMEKAGKVLKIASAPLIKKWTANTIAMGGQPLAHSVAEHIAASAEEEGGGLTKELETKDPVLASLYKGEIVSQNSLAQQLFGKPLRGLSKPQRAQVLLKRGDLILQSAQEASALLPDLTKNEVQESTEKLIKQVSTDPQRSARLASLLKGLDPVGSTTESIVTDTAKETGISNSPAASIKLRKSTKNAERDFKSLGAGAAKDFASLNTITRAFFRVPRNRKVFAEAVSDAQKGNWDKFYEKLKSFDKSGFRYEKPDHRLLYLYANRDSMPSGLSASILRRLRMLNEYKDLSTKEIQDRSKAMIQQMREVSKTNKENVVFASTKLQHPGSAGTKWDKQLTDEYVDKVVDANRRALKNHPEASAAFEGSLARFKRAVRRSKTVDEYNAKMKKLEGSVRSNTRNAKSGNKFDFQ